MSKLDELISLYCPDGVPHKTLGELGRFFGGLTGKSKDDFTDGNAKFITYKNVYSNPALQIDVEDRVKIADGEKQRTLQYGDVVFTGSSETPDECGISSVVTVKTDEKLYLNSFCFFFRFNDLNVMLPDFAKHLFRSSDLRHQIGKTASGVTRFNVSKKLMENVTIPLPPLEVQSEIVRILDSFTQITAELQGKLNAELQARKKQYEYYRDNIILADESLPRKTLEEIAVDIYRGSGIKREEVTETGIPCVRYGEIYTSYNISFTECISHTSEGVVKNPKYFEYGDIIFTITGENVEEIAKSIVYLGNEKCMAGGDTVVLKHTLEPRYLSYALSTTDAQRQKSAGRVKSKVVHSSVPALKAISIPVPPMEKQIMIADVLDSFHYLIEDFSTGLPAEIQARQKQYEYYRDKLLTFPPLS